MGATRRATDSALEELIAGAEVYARGRLLRGHTGEVRVACRLVDGALTDGAYEYDGDPTDRPTPVSVDERTATALASYLKQLRLQIQTHAQPGYYGTIGLRLTIRHGQIAAGVTSEVQTKRFGRQ